MRREVYVCDRCRGEHEEHELAKVTLTPGRSAKGGRPSKAETLDLCTPCVSEFRAWVGTSAVRAAS